MIRAASTGDLPALFALVKAMHGESEFAERGIGLSEPLVRSFLFDGIRRNGGTSAGGTLFNVVEFRGEVVGFMLGLLQPVYLVCAGLEAVDFWLYCTKKAPKIAASLLVDRYIEWAADNPKVRDVILSWTDVVGVDGEKLARIYQRKGFRRRGEIFVRNGA